MGPDNLPGSSAPGPGGGETADVVSLGPGEVLLFLFRRKSVILIAVAVATVVATVGSYLRPLTYRSQASFMVRRDRPPTPTQLTSPNWSIDLDEVIQTEMGILRSSSVIGAVVDDLQLHARPASGGPFERVGRLFQRALQVIGLRHEVPPRDRWIKWIRRRVKIKPIAQSDIISVSLSADDAQLAYEVLQGLSRAYLDKHAEVYQSAGLYPFYEEQVELSKRALDRLHAVEDSLMSMFGVSSVREERDFLLTKRNDLDKQAQSLSSVCRRMEAAVRVLRANIQNSTERFVPVTLTGEFKSLQTSQDQLMELEKQRIELLQRYQHDDRKTASISAKIKEHKLNLAEALEATSTQLRSQRSDVLAQWEELGRSLVEFNKKESRLTEVSLAIDVAEKNYVRYQERLEDSRLEAVGDRQIVNVSVVDKPEVPAHPLRTRLFFIELAAGLSVFLGLGIAFLAELLDPSVHTSAEASRKLRLPTLATVPMRGPDVRRTIKDRLFGSE